MHAFLISFSATKLRSSRRASKHTKRHSCCLRHANVSHREAPPPPPARSAETGRQTLSSLVPGVRPQEPRLLPEKCESVQLPWKTSWQNVTPGDMAVSLLRLTSPQQRPIHRSAKDMSMGHTLSNSKLDTICSFLRSRTNELSHCHLTKCYPAVALDGRAAPRPAASPGHLVQVLTAVPSRPRESELGLPRKPSRGIWCSGRCEDRVSPAGSPTRVHTTETFTNSVGKS